MREYKHWQSLGPPADEFESEFEAFQDRRERNVTPRRPSPAAMFLLNHQAELRAQSARSGQRAIAAGFWAAVTFFGWLYGPSWVQGLSFVGAIALGSVALWSLERFVAYASMSKVAL